MKTEIERKFLVAHDGWKAGVVSSCHIRDGLAADFGSGGKVRVRIAGERATITLKGAREGLARAEFEYSVPVSDAEAMLATFCQGPIVEKTRHLVPHGGLTWEVDVHHGLLAGLVYAEVELALGTHGSVREAVVTANGGKLTAHVRGDATAAELKAHLTNSLPAYMLPAEFRFVEKFPLTPNGKVDRKALADVRTETPGLSEDTGLSLEGRILSLWSAMLGRSVTDAGANFFDLGGNSIHLAVVHVRLREMTGRDFPITDLFAHTSAPALAAHLSPREGTRVSSAVQDRARLAKSGFARFQRHLPR